MNVFKEASRIKLRVNTPQGLLSTEQLWDLSLNKLSAIIKNLKKTMKEFDDDELSFLDETKVVDKEKQMVFDVLKEIYLTKKSELDEEKNAYAIKEHNQKILKLIQSKQEADLGNKSVEELQAMLK
jgi:hypothetical protein